jgi:hypothetical protein
MQKKLAFIGVLLLSLALVPRTAMAELNDGSLSSTGQSTPIHQEENTDSDQRFLAAFRAAHLPLLEAIAIAERLHVGSRTVGISFDALDNPSYRVRTVKDKKIWENVIVHCPKLFGTWIGNDTAGHESVPNKQHHQRA